MTDADSLAHTTLTPHAVAVSEGRRTTMRKNDDLISRQDALSFLRNWERVGGDFEPQEDMRGEHDG